MNAAGLWQGRADPPLSSAGRDQARALAARLAPVGLIALVSSDLRRARETAEELGAVLGLPVGLLTDLREMDVGVWSGLAHAEIAARWPAELARFRSGCETLRPGGGESRRALRVRVAAALATVRERHPEGRVGVVTHLGVLRSLVPGLVLPNAGTFWLGESPTASARASAVSRAAPVDSGGMPL